MANSNWSFGDYEPQRPQRPSDRAVPQEPRSDRIPQPQDIEDLIAQCVAHEEAKLVSAGSIEDGNVTFYPQAELVVEGLVDIFVHELDILDCPACFAQHFKLGETCRKHDV